jgi:polyisoprenoid-binding protein YceI
LPSCALLTLLLAAAPQVFELDAARSHVLVHVDKAGLLAMAGHGHEVEAPLAEGRVLLDAADPATSSVELRFAAAALRVTGRDEPPADVPKVQARMAGPEVLDVARFPEIRFRSTAVSVTPSGGSAWRLALRGELQLRDARGALELPLSASLVGDELRVRGQARLLQTAFGLRPISEAGLEKVKDELLIEIDVVARRVAEEALRPR